MNTGSSLHIPLPEHHVTMVRVQTEAEWDAYHRIRQQEIFSLLPVKYDPNHPSISHPAHHHFVFYQGKVIIGVAEVDFILQDEAGLRPFALDKAYQQKGLGAHCLKALENWLKEQGKRILRLHANPPAVSFYRRLGYNEQPFIEDRFEVIKTIDMAKLL